MIEGVLLFDVAEGKKAFKFKGNAYDLLCDVLKLWNKLDPIYACFLEDKVWKRYMIRIMKWRYTLESIGFLLQIDRLSFDVRQDKICIIPVFRMLIPFPYVSHIYFKPKDSKVVVFYEFRANYFLYLEELPMETFKSITSVDELIKFLSNLVEKHQEVIEKFESESSLVQIHHKSDLTLGDQSS
jgi:hypothetical protein